MIPEQHMLDQLNHYITENTKLIIAAKQMKDALERIKFKANTLSQKRDIARKGLLIDADVAKIIDDYVMEDNND